jgi:hypothetical protein
MGDPLKVRAFIRAAAQPVSRTLSTRIARDWETEGNSRQRSELIQHYADQARMLWHAHVERPQLDDVQD